MNPSQFPGSRGARKNSTEFAHFCIPVFEDVRWQPLGSGLQIPTAHMERDPKRLDEGDLPKLKWQR